MQIVKEQKIEKAVSTDQLRFAMTGVYYNAEKEELIATDGKKLVVLPAKKTNDLETSGLISPVAFTEARKVKGVQHIESNGDIEYLHKDLGLQKVKHIDATYPNYEQVIPKDDGYEIKIGLNPKMLKDISEALGSTESLTLNIKDDLSPIKITGTNKNGGFAILMPLRIK